jgi:hypothetical protein
MKHTLAGLSLVLMLFAGLSMSQEAPPPDPRPLSALMVDLSQDMNRIHEGIWREDFRMIRTGARRIAAHPKIMPEQMAVIKQALGEAFGTFVGYDRLVHDTADSIATLAGSADPRLQRILTLEGQLQQGCVSCHAAYRARVRAALDEADLEMR